MLSQSDQVDVLNQLLNKYDERRLRPMVVHEDTIGRFFRGQVPLIDILLKRLSTSGNYHLKRIVWRILQFIDLPFSHTNLILEIATNDIRNSSDGSFVNNILYTLIHYQLGTRQFLQFLIGQQQLNTQLNYRDKVYDMIVQLEMGEEFYDYGIEGVGVMLTTPTDTFMRSQGSLEEILLSAKSPQSIQKLFDSINSDQWIDFRQYKYSRR